MNIKGIKDSCLVPELLIPALVSPALFLSNQYQINLAQVYYTYWFGGTYYFSGLASLRKITVEDMKKTQE